MCEFVHVCKTGSNCKETTTGTDRGSNANVWVQYRPSPKKPAER